MEVIPGCPFPPVLRVAVVLPVHNIGDLFVKAHGKRRLKQGQGGVISLYRFFGFRGIGEQCLPLGDQRLFPQPHDLREHGAEFAVGYNPVWLFQKVLRRSSVLNGSGQFLGILNLSALSLTGYCRGISGFCSAAGEQAHKCGKSRIGE